MGINDYAIEMNYVNDYLKDDYELIYIDRAGYGYSDDTSVQQTIEQIVSDYRTALKNAGINGPYILLPHSLGGIYATYWENNYQDEISGIIFIDSTTLGNFIYNDNGRKPNIMHYLLYFGSKIGLQRLFLHQFYYPIPVSKENQVISDYLNVRNSLTRAGISELDNQNSNMRKAYESIKMNNIPKIYISSSYGYKTINEYKESLNWKNQKYKELGIKKIQNFTDDEISKKIEECKKLTNEQIIPYIEKMGNTKLAYLPGDHLIFLEKPKELANIIKDFINELN